jgi:DNA invertase Pin-like site-specific DNA recombinase
MAFRQVKHLHEVPLRTLSTQPDTLNVLLSFAQSEREVTGERIREKIGASKRKGLWVGGMVPLDYVSRDKKLAIEEKEAERVRTIFRRYLELAIGTGDDGGAGRAGPA